MDRFLYDNGFRHELVNKMNLKCYAEQNEHTQIFGGMKKKIKQLIFSKMGKRN